MVLVEAAGGSSFCSSSCAAAAAAITTWALATAAVTTAAVAATTVAAAKTKGANAQHQTEAKGPHLRPLIFYIAYTGAYKRRMTGNAACVSPDTER